VLVWLENREAARFKTAPCDPTAPWIGILSGSYKIWRQVLCWFLAEAVPEHPKPTTPWTSQHALHLVIELFSVNVADDVVILHIGNE
jgi:hypothetical protein